MTYLAVVDASDPSLLKGLAEYGNLSGTAVLLLMFAAACRYLPRLVDRFLDTQTEQIKVFQEEQKELRETFSAEQKAFRELFQQEQKAERDRCDRRLDAWYQALNDKENAA
jgi:hypothetical protein